MKEKDLPPNLKDMTRHERFLCLLEILISKDRKLALRELDKLREENEYALDPPYWDLVAASLALKDKHEI
jgi:hypothetical protein